MQSGKANKRIHLAVDITVWTKIEKAAAGLKVSATELASFILSKRFNQPAKHKA